MSRLKNALVTLAAAASAGVASATVAGAETNPPRPGSLDRSFGIEGKVITPIAGARVFVGGVVNGPGGGFYVAANTGNPPGNITGGRMLILRYDSRGRLVRSFGTRGVVSHGLGQGAATVAELVRQRDGRLVVVGSVEAPGVPGNRNVLVARLTPSGQLDPSFGDDGVATTDLPGTGDAATDIVIQPDGRLVVVGFVHPDYTATQRSSEMVVLRYTASGQLDPGFGNAGVVRRTVDDVGGAMSAEAVALQREGSILVAGNLGVSQRGRSQAMLARLHPDGAFDESIGAPDLSGIVLLGLEDSISDIATDRQQRRVYVAGRSSSDTDETSRLYLASLRADLTLRSEFGTGGVARARFPGTSVGFATSVVVDAKGRIVLAGSVATPPTGALALARFTSAGSPDKRFGHAGRVRVRVGRGWNVARSLVLQPHGRILVAGNNRSGQSIETAPAITLARVNGG